MRKYGIPSDVRKQGIGMKWYSENVQPHISKSILDVFDAHPVAFMCMETNVEDCHRKVILEELTKHGVKGKDLRSR